MYKMFCGFCFFWGGGGLGFFLLLLLMFHSKNHIYSNLHNASFYSNYICKIYVQNVIFYIFIPRLYKGCGLGRPFGSKCLSGDRMGCGIKFDQNDASGMRLLVKVFFTKNGEEVRYICKQLNYCT